MTGDDKAGDDKAARRFTQALERSREYYTISGNSGFDVAWRGDGLSLEIGTIKLTRSWLMAKESACCRVPAVSIVPAHEVE